MEIKIKDIDFPSFDDFKKCRTIEIFDYRITFSVEVRQTKLGTVNGNLSFYITGIDKYRGVPFLVNNSNYELAKTAIREDRNERILRLAEAR